MTLGLLLTSFALGLRHGVDWDHIAAIADLNSASDDRRRGFRLSVWYAVGHAIVVLALGSLLILAGAAIPASLDDWMGRIVGLTLVGLGIMVLVDLVRNRGTVRLRSRWMLILDGTFAGLRRVRQLRGRRQISVEHDHEHDHDDSLPHADAPSHDHAHDRVHDRSPAPVPVARDGASSADGSGMRRRHRHPHVHRVELPVGGAPAAPMGNGVAAGIGMLHGVGIESPTQIAVFVASTSVVGAGGGIVLLVAWVAGLVAANAALAVAAGRGLLRPDTNAVLVRVVALVVAAVSIAIGVRYLIT